MRHLGVDLVGNPLRTGKLAAAPMPFIEDWNEVFKCLNAVLMIPLAVTWEGVDMRVKKLSFCIFATISKPICVLFAPFGFFEALTMLSKISNEGYGGI